MLADYVLALLRHDGGINDVRKLCEEEIPDFLKEGQQLLSRSSAPGRLTADSVPCSATTDSPVFVNDVFEAIAYRSYLPGAPPPPSNRAGHGAPAQLAPDMYYDQPPMGPGPGPAPSFPPPQFQNGSRKRGYRDWDEPNPESGPDGGGFGGRPLKQLRRGGRGARQDDMANFRGVPGMPPFPSSGQLPPQGPPHPSAVGYFDPKGGMGAAMFGMSLAAGHPMPELMSHDRNRPPKKRKKCRDWEKKGFCQRGSSCNFEHSTDASYAPLPMTGPLVGAMPPLPQPLGLEGMARRLWRFV